MNSIQIGPAWTKTESKEDLETDFGFEITGSGLYLSLTDTVLITIPTRHAVNFWYGNIQAGEMLTAHVYNCPFHETIFSVIRSMPNRLDTRPVPDDN